MTKETTAIMTGIDPVEAVRLRYAIPAMEKTKQEWAITLRFAVWCLSLVLIPLLTLVIIPVITKIQTAEKIAITMIWALAGIWIAHDLFDIVKLLLDRICPQKKSITNDL